MKKILMFLFLGLMSAHVYGQLSNAQIMKIKDDADDGKSLWTKLFEDAYSKQDMSGLPGLRKANEDYLSENISKLSRMYAEGDGRELIVAVKNYLVVEQQFVKDVMKPAESLKPGDETGYNELNMKIADFTKKERSFEIDISNALRSSPEPMVAEPQEADEPEEQPVADDADEDSEEAAPDRREKFPHETYDGKKKKKRRK